VGPEDELVTERKEAVPKWWEALAENKAVWVQFTVLQATKAGSR
jgi:hypothetical protein